MTVDAARPLFAPEGAEVPSRTEAPALLTLSDPTRPLDPSLIDRPGGFAWWYVDLIDPEGNGFVVIWSFGLPFLPGYLHAARAERPELPRARPSLNVALYRGGRPSFYLLQEYSPDEADWQPGAETWRFGRSRVRSRVERGVRTVELELACDVPGTHEELRGEILLSGTVPRIAPGPRQAPGRHHEWSPLAGPAPCSARFLYGEREELAVEGLAYHDRNGGDAPLDRLGIAEWTWGRAVTEEELLAYYVVWPEGGALGATTPLAWTTRIERDGAVEHATGAALEAGPPARATYGMRHLPELRLVDAAGRVRTSATTARVIDDGPFYLRTLADVSRPGRGAVRGFAEWVRPARVDLHRHRPFVKMRVHRTQGDNSLWLPLFSGPRDGRVRRLFGLGRG